MTEAILTLEFRRANLGSGNCGTAESRKRAECEEFEEIRRRDYLYGGFKAGMGIRLPVTSKSS